MLIPYPYPIVLIAGVLTLKTRTRIKIVPFQCDQELALDLRGVPASALPAPLGFSKEHSDKDRRENDAERTQAYIDYLMEGN